MLSITQWATLPKIRLKIESNTRAPDTTPGTVVLNEARGVLQS